MEKMANKISNQRESILLMPFTVGHVSRCASTSADHIPKHAIY